MCVCRLRGPRVRQRIINSVGNVEVCAAFFLLSPNQKARRVPTDAALWLRCSSYKIRQHIYVIYFYMFNVYTVLRYRQTTRRVSLIEQTAHFFTCTYSTCSIVAPKTEHSLLWSQHGDLFSVNCRNQNPVVVVFHLINTHRAAARRQLFMNQRL